jgi:hypothetical protein
MENVGMLSDAAADSPGTGMLKVKLYDLLAISLPPW